MKIRVSHQRFIHNVKVMLYIWCEQLCFNVIFIPLGAWEYKKILLELAFKTSDNISAF